MFMRVRQLLHTHRACTDNRLIAREIKDPLPVSLGDLGNFSVTQKWQVGIRPFFIPVYIRYWHGKFDTGSLSFLR